MNKTITQQDYLIAMGLFHLAHTHSKKSDEYRDALNAHLGLDESAGAIEDQVYAVTDGTLDAALEFAEIKVEPCA